LTVNFSSATTDAKKQWKKIFRVLRANNCEPTIRYLAKLSFKSKGKIKTSGLV
jgi:hypothetical protein